MNLNFTPFFSRFKPDPAFRVITSLFVVAVVIVGLNQFTNQLANPNCTTPIQLTEMYSQKTSLEGQISNVDLEIESNNNNIVSLQESFAKVNYEISSITSMMNLTGDYYIAQLKKTLDARYATYVKYRDTSRKNLSPRSIALLDKMTASAKTTYENTLTQYNKDVATNEENKARLLVLNDEKVVIEAQIVGADQKYVELNATRSNLVAQLDTLNTAILSAESNMCPTSETACSNGFDDDGDNLTDCSDPDCTGDMACNTSGCNPMCGPGQTCSNSVCVDDGGGCPGGCPAGQTCSAGACTGDQGCSITGCPAGQVCSGDVCVGDGSCNPSCTSNQACVDGSCVDNPPECTNDADCSVGNVCIGGACVKQEDECTDSSACNFGSKSVCDYSCKIESCTIDSAEFTPYPGDEEMGNWKVTGTFFGIFKVENKEAAKSACDSTTINCKEGWAKDEKSVRAIGPWKYWTCYLDLGSGACNFSGPKETCTLYQP